MKRTLFVLLALCLAVPVIAATIGGIGGSGGGGGAASAAGSTNAVQTNVNGALADSGCLAVSGSARMVCTNGLQASIATLTNITATQATTSLITASFATITQLTVTQRTGNGAVVYATSPTLGTPNLGVPSSINLVNATAMPATGLTGTVAIGNGGTGSTSFTGSRCIESNAGGTALVVAAAACGTGGGGAASAVGASGTIQAANNSSALSDSGCTVGSYGRMTCPGGFVAGTSSLGVISMIEGSATIAGATPGQHNIWIDSTDGVLHTFKNGAATAATYMTTTNGATMVNKSYNVESTGNYLTVVKPLWFPAAGASGASAGAVWDTPASAGAVASAVTGTNVIKAVLDFANNNDLSAQITYRLSRFWKSGTVEALINWFTEVTSGNAVWYLQTACTADGSTDDPSFNATDANTTVVDAAKGTARQLNTATLPNITMTGCSPRSLLHLKIRRHAGDPNDTLAGTASFYGLELTIREQQTTVAQ
jgi:hypothetical protein